MPPHRQAAGALPADHRPGFCHLAGYVLEAHRHLVAGLAKAFEMAERGYRFSMEEKERINKLLMEDRKLPDFGLDVEQVSYADAPQGALAAFTRHAPAPPLRFSIGYHRSCPLSRAKRGPCGPRPIHSIFRPPWAVWSGTARCIWCAT